MEDRYLFRGKRIDNGEWVVGNLIVDKQKDIETGIPIEIIGIYPSEYKDFSKKIDPATICQCTGLKDKNGNLIWENDILMCHDNPNDLVKVVFGKFTVINAETLENIDEVIGWHYEVIPTDDISRCEPFCLSMPITEDYVKTCEFEVIGNMIDNPKLLEREEELPVEKYEFGGLGKAFTSGWNACLDKIWKTDGMRKE